MSRTFFSLNKKRKRAQKLKVIVIETLADTLSAYEIQNQANPGEARKLLFNLLHKVAKFQENLRLPSSEMTADQMILLKLKMAIFLLSVHVTIMIHINEIYFY